MTYPAPDVVPYDEWFDPNYKYNPDKDMDLAPSSVEPQDEEEETVHEKMYKIDLKHNQFHIPGNALYDRNFFRWVIKEEYDVDIKDEEYIVTFLDHNMNYITLLDTCYILIEEEDYKLINIDNDKSM